MNEPHEPHPDETSDARTPLRVVVSSLVHARFAAPDAGFSDRFTQLLGACEADVEWLQGVAVTHDFTAPDADPPRAVRAALHELALNGFADAATPELESLLRVYTHLERTAAVTAEQLRRRRLRKAAREAPPRRKAKRH